MGVYDFYRREPSGLASSLSELVETVEEEQQESGDEMSPRKATAVAKAHAVEKSILEVLPSRPELGVSDPVKALRLIREDLGDCTRCALHKQGRKQIVFGVGNPNAELLFVGEGPGADEDEQGEPFVGRSGQLLTNMIKAMGLSREQVYIANIVKCRPPGNRAPEREESETCSPFLMRQIAAIKPKVVVALGATAAKGLLAMSAPMTQLRGRFYDFKPPGVRDPDWEGCKLAITYHPAFLLRDPRQKGEAWKDLQMVMRELGLKASKATT
ncbi:MAG: uracil-DNA glycosylase [Acidobacteria bacterium]|nr:MAG: uracil-DNA glycosylase [Acidobacteriota bacterium]